jgi:hypothetical protein
MPWRTIRPLERFARQNQEGRNAGEVQMSVRKRISVLLTVAIVVLTAVIWAHAQSRVVVPGWTPVEPIAPTVISDGDIGFRLFGMRGQTPVGQWVVRINGEWKNVEAGGDPHFQMR